MELSLNRCSNAIWRSRVPISSETFTDSFTTSGAAGASGRLGMPGS